MKMTIKSSTKPNKKLMATFTQDNGRTKTTHFGAKGMKDYTITGDKERRRLYRERHKKDLSTKDPTRAGYLSYYILWGESTSRQQNISTYKKRFNL
tara:strand:+ start:3938 stop:4225 length:288 start_codon:yes stop_codon:yes gene_type:complete